MIVCVWWWLFVGWISKSCRWSLICATIRTWFKIMGEFWLVLCKLFLMVLLFFLYCIFIWKILWVSGMRWEFCEKLCNINSFLSKLSTWLRRFWRLIIIDVCVIVVGVWFFFLLCVEKLWKGLILIGIMVVLLLCMVYCISIRFRVFCARDSSICERCFKLKRVIF